MRKCAPLRRNFTAQKHTCCSRDHRHLETRRGSRALLDRNEELMDKLKKVLSGQDDGSADGGGILERANQASTLAWGTRMKGFLICFILGAFCSILPSSVSKPSVSKVLLSVFSASELFVMAFVSEATCLLWIPGFGLPVFAVLYSLGNVCALSSTMFLIGPCRQLKTMCAKERALATAIMLVCLVLTLCSAFWWKNNGLALLFCVLQFLAFTWYGLSYIPFARDAVMKLFSLCM